MSEINQWAWENLQRKLAEANERIVEFDRIKAGHLELLASRDAEVAELRLRLRNLVRATDNEAGTT